MFRLLLLAACVLLLTNEVYSQLGNKKTLPDSLLHKKVVPFKLPGVIPDSSKGTTYNDNMPKLSPPANMKFNMPVAVDSSKKYNMPMKKFKFRRDSSKIYLKKPDKTLKK